MRPSVRSFRARGQGYGTLVAGFNARTIYVSDPSNGGAMMPFTCYIWVGASVDLTAPCKTGMFAHGSGEWGTLLSQLTGASLPKICNTAPSTFADWCFIFPHKPNMSGWEGSFGQNPTHQFLDDLHNFTVLDAMSVLKIDFKHLAALGYSVGGADATRQVLAHPTLYCSLFMAEPKIQGNKLTPTDSSTTDAQGFALMASNITIPVYHLQNDNDATATPSTQGRPIAAAFGAPFTTPFTTPPTYTLGEYLDTISAYEYHERTGGGLTNSYFNPPGTGGHDGEGPFEAAVVKTWLDAKVLP